MKLSISILSTVFALIISNSSAFGQDNTLDWQIFNASKTGKVQAGEKYGLWCNQQDDFPIAERRDMGVNIKWKKQNPLNITFKKKNGNGSIATGERIAIFFDGAKGGYLYYKKRDNGVNLEFSTEPKYEWEIRNGANKDGDNIQVEERLALFSSVENDFLIGCTWSFKDVVNLAWCKDCLHGKRIQGVPAPIRKKVTEWAIKAAPLLL